MRTVGRPTAIALVALIVLTAAVPGGATTKPQLRAKALALSDFPAGWSIDHSSSSATTNSACLKGLKKTFKHDIKVSVSYTDGQAPALEETLEAGPGVNAHYAAFTKKIESCQTINITSDGQTITGTVGAMSFPREGDRSRAWAVTLTIQGVTIGADVVLFQVGSVLGDVVYEDLGTPAVSEVESFVVPAVAKIKGDIATVAPTTTGP